MPAPRWSYAHPALVLRPPRVGPTPTSQPIRCGSYSWEPRRKLNQPNRYVRLNLRNYFYCSYFAGGDSSATSLITEAQSSGVDACNFPVEHVEKAVFWDESRRGAVYGLVRHLTMSSQELAGLMATYDAYRTENDDVSEEQAYHVVACDWLAANNATAEKWMTHDLYADPGIFGVWNAYHSTCLDEYVTLLKTI